MILPRSFFGERQKTNLMNWTLSKFIVKPLRWVSEKWTSRNNLGDNYVLGGIQEFTMKRVRRQFTVEFKKNAVSLVVDEKRSVSEVAKSLNISSKTLSTWLRQSKEGKLEGKIASNVDDKTMQMAAIMAENQRLKAEVLLLKKFAAYLSKNGLQ